MSVKEQKVLPTESHKVMFYEFSGLCNMPDTHNMTNLSSLCGPSFSPLPQTFLFIIQIFYAIICLLGKNYPLLPPWSLYLSSPSNFHLHHSDLRHHHMLVR